MTSFERFPGGLSKFAHKLSFFHKIAINSWIDLCRSQPCQPSFACEKAARPRVTIYRAPEVTLGYELEFIPATVVFAFK